MSKVTLTGTFKVEQIIKKTQAVFFKDLQVGDCFTLSYNLSGRYKSAPAASIYVGDQLVHSNPANQLANNLDDFRLIQVGEEESI